MNSPTPYGQDAPAGPSSAGPSTAGSSSAGPSTADRLPAAPLLPAALAPWSDSLSALTPVLAAALGPMVRRIDALIGEREPFTAAEGDLDGYGGLARTGRPDQLTPSEWLLAEEFPEEFLRRLADGELLYTAPEFRTPAARGRVVVLADTGPAQAGAGRLVQLAALIVLHRRAAARGAELAVRILGSPAGQWLTGDLPDLLPRWLAARSATDPGPDTVRTAEAELDAADRAWLLASPALAGELTARRRVLTSETTRWDAHGATHVTLSLGGGTAELPLPAPAIAVRALRGAEFHRAVPGAEPPPVADGLGLPAFTGPGRTLLVRGAGERRLYAVDVSGSSGRETARERRHDLPGAVVAAARIGRRLVTLVVRGDRLATCVIGRPLPGGERTPADRGLIGLDDALLAELRRSPVLPLLLDGDALLAPLAGRWWRIARDGTAVDDGPVAPPGATAPGGPAFVWARELRLFGGRLPPEAAAAAHRLHGNGAVAWSQDGRQWEVQPLHRPRVRIGFRAEAELLGMVDDGATTALITRTRSDALVRSLTVNGVRTLNRFSGEGPAPAVHPTLPLIAAEPQPGRILVGDAFTGRIHRVLRSER
ncbi:hypothetical protein [Kitasatospora sp. NPDC088346]|uniref:hypothetical protein n=1 Tax=Kitasatospora sp. NPDC088346 TaxID=3364073 RepID=UPI003806C2C6